MDDEITMRNDLSYWEFYDTNSDQICDQSVRENIVTAINPAQTAQVKEYYELCATKCTFL